MTESRAAPPTSSNTITIIAVGAGAVGKSTLLRALHAAIPGSFYIDKDEINQVLLGDEPYFGPFYRDFVKPRTYALLFHIAEANLLPNRTLILDGYFADKMETPELRALAKKSRMLVLRCEAPRAVIAQRARERGHHRDAQYLSTDELFAAQQRLHEERLEALPIDYETLTVRTTDPLETNIKLVLNTLSLDTDRF